MDLEKQKILDIWKKAVENYENKKKKLCKKYKVKLKEVEVDESYAKFEFENGIEFDVPYGEDFDDYDLTGDALNFAKRYNDIVQDCYYEVDENMEEIGFEKWDSDEWYNLWRKDGMEYEVNHYAKKEEDINILEVKTEHQKERKK